MLFYKSEVRFTFGPPTIGFEMIVAVDNGFKKEWNNFPFKAIEELLANAIVHKNYENQKSIHVYINEREINIVSYNSPLPPITIKDLNERYYFHERDAINPEIRDMFKALGIIESYGTGVSEAKKIMW